MWRALRAILFHLVVALLLVSAAVYVWAHVAFISEGPLRADHTVIVEKGAGVEAIGEALEAAGVVSDARIFALGVRVTGQDRRLKAGEYAFPARLSMRGVADLLESGRTVRRRLTVAEGLTTAETLAVLDETPGLDGALAEPPDEGVLLPETYFYAYGESRADIVRRMREAMERTLAELWPERSDDLAVKTRREAVVLASIIEKETAVADERPRVSAVFHNRLRRGMRLQSDPTVVYALTEGQGPLGRALTRDDLKIESPYNTYRKAGLPPTPIANPGRASIEAALKPADSDALYFVADGNGGHVFARTLKEHLKNVRHWRRMRDGGDGSAAK